MSASAPYTVEGKQNIVIVGGGGVAVKLLTALLPKIDRTKYRVIVVNPRPFYTHLLVGARITVTDHGKFEDTALVPFDRVLVGDDALIVSIATSIQRPAGSTRGGTVTLADGALLPFAFLVLGTGSTWPEGLNWPNTKAEVGTWLEDHRRGVKEAKSIVIAGAGAVGIEISGELRHFYPEKKITLVQKSEQVLNDSYKDKLRRYVETRLRGEGVNLILGDTVIDTKPVDGVVHTSSGQHIAADLLIQAVGATPNTAWIRSSLGDSIITSTGHVKTKSTLQLRDYPEIFVAGDILDWPEQKTISKTEPQAKVIAANILSIIKGTAATKEYKGFFEVLVMPFGPKRGVSFFNVLWGLIFGNWVTSLLKKDLLVGMFRSPLKY